MTRSTIKTLPSELLEQLQAWLRDPTISQLEATERLNELLEEIGEKPRSKSAVNRYAVEMNEIGEKIQQSREFSPRQSSCRKPMNLLIRNRSRSWLTRLRNWKTRQPSTKNASARLSNAR